MCVVDFSANQLAFEEISLHLGGTTRFTTGIDY